MGNFFEFYSEIGLIGMFGETRVMGEVVLHRDKTPTPEVEGEPPLSREPTVGTNGPVLVLGGYYGNLEAARAHRAEATRLGIRPEHMARTGAVAAEERVRQPRPKFSDPEFTARGERRASVAFKALDTVWFNTGTLCNLACKNCYIESSPSNDRLAYLTRAEVRRFLKEAEAIIPRPAEIGFTGGEPFMNPDLLGMIEDSLAAGFRVLVLTNAMKPMQRMSAALFALHKQFPGQLTLRVSLDHYEAAGHERMRGPRSWRWTIDGLRWLVSGGFNISIAGRTVWGETDVTMRAGYAALFMELGLRVDARDPAQLVLFPEMKVDEDVPEITEHCWDILGKRPDSVMCATSRMVVKRRGADQPTVISCTLLPYDGAFELGSSLADAARPVKLNHRYCASFCVLGGASCSPRGYH